MTFDHRLIAIIAIMGFGVFTVAGLQPILPLYLTSIGVAPQILGLMFSTAMVGMVIGESSGGWLADRFGLRFPLIIGTFVCVPLILSFVLTRNIAWIFLIFFLWGIARATIYGELELGGTNNLYILTDTPDKFDLPVNPKVPGQIPFWQNIVQPWVGWLMPLMLGASAFSFVTTRILANKNGHEEGGHE